MAIVIEKIIPRNEMILNEYIQKHHFNLDIPTPNPVIDAKHLVHEKCRFERTSLKWELYQYKVGSSTMEHIETKQAPTHWGTLLLFPPSFLSPFEGGDLTVGNETFRLSESREWMGVAIPVDTSYQFTALTSGVSHVFKSQIHTSQVCPVLSQPTHRVEKIPVDAEATQPIIDAMNKLKERLRQIVADTSYETMKANLWMKIDRFLKVFGSRSVVIGIAGEYGDCATISELKGLEYQVAYDLLQDYNVDLVEINVNITLDKFGLLDESSYWYDEKGRNFITLAPGYKFGYHSTKDSVYNDEFYEDVKKTKTFALLVTAK